MSCRKLFRRVPSAATSQVNFLARGTAGGRSVNSDKLANSQIKLIAVLEKVAQIDLELAALLRALFEGGEADAVTRAGALKDFDKTQSRKASRRRIGAASWLCVLFGRAERSNMLRGRT
jgi:hypothetical protein